jgi:hypothetical protein
MRVDKDKPLKKITLEEASKYISANEDFNNNFICFYTVEPSDDPNHHFNDGWEFVKYYTNRRKPKIKALGNETINPDGYIEVGDGPNIVYIMSNPAYAGLLKIGSTRKLVEERRKQLSSASGVPYPFKIEWILKLDGNELQLENEIHHYLEHKRSNMNREFFDITLSEAIEVIKKVGEKYI